MPEYPVQPPPCIAINPACPRPIATALRAALPEVRILAHNVAEEAIELTVIGLPAPAPPEPGWRSKGAFPLLPALVLCEHDSHLVRDAWLLAGADECTHIGHPELLRQTVLRLIQQHRRQRKLEHYDETERRQRASLRALASSIPGLILHLTLDRDGHTHVRLASEASLMLLGLRPEVLQDGPDRLIDCIVEADRPALMVELARSAQALTPINWEGRIRSLGGDIKWINLRATVTPGANGETSWEGVMWNITQSKCIEQELRDSREQLAAFSAHLEQAKEEERERIARDIHDVLGGHLVAIRFNVSFILSRLTPRQQTLRDRTLSIQHLVDDAIATVSRVTRELRPGILKDFGLFAAVECQAEDFHQRTGIDCRVRCDGEEPELPEATAIALFRIFQETLTNITKHAKARSVEVTMTYTPAALTLTVEDDGKGFVAADLAKPLSFGLRGIRERLVRLGGTALIEQRSPQGTRVRLSLPLARIPLPPDTIRA